MTYLLFEEENYSINALERLGLEFLWNQTGPVTAKFNHVGFFKNYKTNISVFTLPKIFIHDGKVFNRYPLETFIEHSIEEILTLKEFEIIKGLTEKLYFCLRQYQREEATSVVEYASGFSIKSNIGPNRVGSFEAMLALIHFNKQNPYLFVQERQIMESRSPRIINWKKTLSSTMPMSVEGGLHYMELIGSSKTSKRDDPLLVIYYSLLNAFKQYDPTIIIDSSVNVMTPARLERLKSKIGFFLKTSRSLYFSDKFKQLHSLLQSYYFAEKATYSNNFIEYLFTDSFERVFERIVDSLISDDALIATYKNLKDGKEIDHLFGDEDLFRGNKIIYIGDSKYYKDASKVAFQKHKQFTYARNIIQENIYIVNRGQETIYSRSYRDQFSEGYNVTPNFFVLGTVASNYLESPTLIQVDSQPPELSYHFHNRLFDRDTLHILYFKIDFLIFLNFYIGRERRLSLSRQIAREKSRTYIQKQFIQYLNIKYEFYRIKLSVSDLELHFRHLHGKVFRSPSVYPDYILALESSFAAENNALVAKLKDTGIEPSTFVLSEPSDF